MSSKPGLSSGDAIPLYDAQTYLATLVCSAYSGKQPLPKACYDEVPAPQLQSKVQRTPASDAVGSDTAAF
jgi:hypothetical protein